MDADGDIRTEVLWGGVIFVRFVAIFVCKM